MKKFLAYSYFIILIPVVVPVAFLLWLVQIWIEILHAFRSSK